MTRENGKRDVRLVAYVTADDLRRLQATAEREHRTLSGLVQVAIRTYLANDRKGDDG
jgi:hypothetical protein